MPESPLAEITLRAAVTVPPTKLLLPPAIVTPEKVFPSASQPVALTPMKLPWSTL